MNFLTLKVGAVTAVLSAFSLGLPRAQATLLSDSLGGVPGVHRHATEIHLLGDFDADGVVDDWLLIERETGFATLVRGIGGNSVFTPGGWAYNYTLSINESYRIYAGVDPVDDAVACAINTNLSVGSTNYTIEAGFAAVSSTDNRLVLTLNPGDLGRNPAAAAIGRVPSNIGSIGLVAQGVADAGVPTGNDSLYVLSEANSVGAAGQFFECFSLPVDSASSQYAGFATAAGESYRDLQSADAPNRFFALRDTGLATHLLLIESGPLPKTLSLVDTSPALGAGAHMTFGRFSGSANQIDCIFWRAGQTTIQFSQLAGDTFSALESADLGAVPRFITAVPDTNIFIVVFEDDTAVSYKWLGLGYAPKFHDSLGSATNGGFTGVITHPDGSIGLLEGSYEVSTQLRPFAFLEDGSAFAERPTIDLPQNVPTGSRGSAITAMTFTGTPLEDDDATPREALRFGDWGDGWFPYTGGDVGIRSLTFDPNIGLTYLSASRASLSQAYDDVMVNQVSENVSAYVGAGAVGPIGPAVSISPNPARPLASPVVPEVIATLPASTIFYRFAGEADWSTASGGFLRPIVEDTVVEVFAESAVGVPGRVETFSYTFITEPGQRDSDGDGVPDAIEAGYGLDPTSGPDADGDGVTDLVEIIYELDQADAGTPLASSAVSDPNVFPATGKYPYSGYPVALDAGGLLQLEVTVTCPVAQSSLSASQFALSPSSFDATADLAPASGTVRVMSTGGAGLGSGLLGAGAAQIVTSAVSAEDFQLLLGTDRSMTVVPADRPKSEHFDLNDGGWRFSNNALCQRIAYAERPDDYFLSVTSKTGRNEVVNQTAEWIGDWLADGADALRMRASNFDKNDSAHLRVVLSDSVAAPNTTYWVSRDAGVMAPAVENAASGSAEAPWHELAWQIELPEVFTDANGNGTWDEGETWVDSDSDGEWTAGSFVRMQGSASFPAVLSDVASLKIIHSVEPALESPLGFAGFHLDNIRFEDGEASAGRLLAAVQSPEFSHPFVPFVDDGVSSFASNVAAWNVQREAAWQSSASIVVDVDAESTLSYLLYEYALEQGLENLGTNLGARNLGDIRDADEVTPVTARDETIDNGETANGVTLTAPSDQIDDAQPSFMTFPVLSSGGASVSREISFPAGEPSVFIDFDKALYGEYFTVSQQGQQAYRGKFSSGAIAVEALAAATPLTSEELGSLYFPSEENAYAPIYGDIFKAVDPAAVLDSITAAVSTNFGSGAELSEVVTALYRLNSAFGSRAPETFDDPVRALRGFLREGEEGLGGPSVVASPRWRAGLSALGLTSSDLDSAKQQADLIMTAALASRTVVLSESMQIVAGTGAISERINDMVGTVVRMVDKDGETFPLPDAFPLTVGTRFDVTGYELAALPGGERVIEVIFLDLEYLPRAPVVDADGDLLDDRWEMLFHGDMNRIGMEDSDGDGFLDFEEFVEGTDPSSDQDYPAGTAEELLLSLKIEMDASGNALLRLPMGSNFFEELGYQVMENDTLNGLWEARSPESSYTQGGDQVFVIPRSENSSFFYRLSLFLQ